MSLFSTVKNSETISNNFIRDLGEINKICPTEENEFQPLLFIASARV